MISTLRSFALFGAGLSGAGAWSPPVTLAGGVLTAVGLGGEWILTAQKQRSAPAAMFTDARRRFGWEDPT
jgi:hypothetical protein